MSHFIIRSGPKYIPEGQTLSMTSLVPIHQHSVAIFLGQGQDASQPLSQSPLSPQKHITFVLRAPCAMEVAAVPGQEHRGCRSTLATLFCPSIYCTRERDCESTSPPPATSLCSHLRPAPLARQNCPMCDAAGEASAHRGSTTLILKCRNAFECLVWNQNPWILFNFNFVLFKVLSVSS